MRKLLLLLTLCVLGKNSFAQDTIINHHCDFTSGHQNMWGPSFSAFTINQNIDIFNFPWNTSGGTGNSGIVTILGQSFGAAASFSTSGVIGAKFSLEGFTTGEVQVDYPVDITLTKPNDNTFNQGQTVSIATDYTVASGYALDTWYPSLGTAKLDMYFQFAASANITLCAFGCTTIPIIPSFSSPTITLNIFNISAAGVYFLGPGCAEAIPYYSANAGPGGVGEPSPDQNVFPFALPLYEEGCTAIPWQVHYDFLPLDLGSLCSPCADYGIGGELTIPYVETTDNLGGNNLTAFGDSTYVVLELEVFKLIGHILAESEIPYASQVGMVLENLSNDFELPAPFGTIYGATLHYNIMSASFKMDITNRQRFDFKPKIFGKFEFPVPVQYTIKDNLGVVLSSGVSAIINCQIGNEIEYEYPCYYSELAITPTYTIVGDFSNHTYDSIGFSFNFSALEFGFNLPAIQILPAIHIPSFCFDLPYPCPSWSHPFRWCTTTVCTPEINIPAVVFSGFHFNIGPLINESYPIAEIKYDWFNQTWNLGGFSPCTHPSFKMKARLFSASAIHTNVNCKGNSTGSVTVAVSNGNSPFNYAWTNGSTATNLISLPANDYLVTITDAKGCQTTTGATVTEPASILTVSAVQIDKSCFGGVNNGSIDLTAQGGTTPYGFLWSNTQTTEDISNLAAGVYSVNVTDSKGCTASLARTITEPTALLQTGSTVPVDCFGGMNGAASAVGLGGTSPYSYLWSNGAISENIAGLAAGTYSLNVTDINGCTSSAAYVVSQPATLPTLSLSTVPVSCHGGVNGSIDLTPIGGTPGYNYAWFNNANNALPFTTQDISNLSAGTYSVHVTDNKGCLATGSIQVSEPGAAIADHAALTHILCFGQSTGSIVSGIIGGTPGYTYSWSNGASSADLNNVPAGSYSVVVTDSKGCTANYSYTLNQPNAPLSLLLTPSAVKCFGDATGSIVSEVAGGTLPYTYTWSTGATSPSIASLTAGTYNLSVTDGNGCLIAGVSNITQPAAALSATNTHTDVNCFNGNNGAIDVTTSGGTSPYSYVWWNSTNQLLVNTTEDLSTLTASTYVVHIYDANNCQQFDTIQVVQPAAAIAITAIMDDVNCFGANSGALDATTTGGTLPYSFAWSDGQSTEDAIALTAGNYTLTVTDGKGCVQANSFNVVQPLSALNTVLTPTAILCNGGTDGAITSIVNGGTAPYTYSWSNSATTASIHQVSAGVYTLTTTDAKGCFSFSGTTIMQPAAPLNALVTVTDASCYGYADGAIQLNVSGGTQPYGFIWSNNVEVILNNPSESLGNLVANNYLVRIHDKNNCEWEQVVIVGQPTPFIATAVPTQTLCNGDSTGSIQLSVVGGTLPYVYLWSNGQTTQNAANVSSGTYFVNVTDGQGCIVRDTTFVSQPLPIYVSVSTQEVSCVDQADGSINITVAGGMQPYSYVWNTGQITQDISDLNDGVYTIIVTDQNACIKVTNIVIDPMNNECVHPVNTFTPNGDLYNDTWIIDNMDLYPNASIEVFNKWGKLVHSQHGVYEPWDGKSNGEVLPSDVYYYIIDLYNDQENKYTGSITIIR